jgi:hypothetical protein
MFHICVSSRTCHLYWPYRAAAHAVHDRRGHGVEGSVLDDQGGVGVGAVEENIGGGATGSSDGIV